MSQNDLDRSLKMLLETLPEETETPHKRRNALTRQDAALIASMIKIAMNNQGCSIGLDAHQIAALKNTPADIIESMAGMVRERKQLLNAVGAATLAILAWLGKILFDSIDWHKIAGLFKGNH
jgi:hypothetical protein